MFYHCYKKVWAPAWLRSMFWIRLCLFRKESTMKRWSLIFKICSRYTRAKTLFTEGRKWQSLSCEIILKNSTKSTQAKLSATLIWTAFSSLIPVRRTSKQGRKEKFASTSSSQVPRRSCVFWRINFALKFSPVLKIKRSRDPLAEKQLDFLFFCIFISTFLFHIRRRREVLREAWCS